MTEDAGREADKDPEPLKHSDAERVGSKPNDSHGADERPPGKDPGEGRTSKTHA